MSNSAPVITPARIKASGGCSNCPALTRCRDERLWLAGPLPCEALLSDEIGREFEPDSSPSYYVIPLGVRVSIEVDL